MLQSSTIQNKRQKLQLKNRLSFSRFDQNKLKIISIEQIDSLVTRWPNAIDYISFDSLQFISVSRIFFFPNNKSRLYCWSQKTKLKKKTRKIHRIVKLNNKIMSFSFELSRGAEQMKRNDVETMQQTMDKVIIHKKKLPNNTNALHTD